MLGAAWAVNDGAVESVTVTAKDPLNDERVIRKLYKAIDSADILCGHNLALFDQKKFNARAIKYGLDPIEKKPVIDTLRIAKSQFSFTSNKLRYICDYLGIAGKDESPDWDAILDGDTQAIKYMREYNEQDIIATRELYLKLRAWYPNHPDFRKISPAKDVSGSIILDQCSGCGSLNTHTHQTLMTPKGKVRNIRCKDCGKLTRVKHSKS
jgi:hypothetical protein